MPHCNKHKSQMATEFVTYPDGHKGFVCKLCKEKLEFAAQPKEARLARLRALEVEIEDQEEKLTARAKAPVKK